MEEEGRRPVFLPFMVYQDRRRSSPYEKFLLGHLHQGILFPGD
jgi:hypothetical protein